MMRAQFFRERSDTRKGLAGKESASLAMLCLATGLLVADAPPAAEWWTVPIASNLQGVTHLFVDRGSIDKNGSFRTAWLFETFHPAATQTRSKKEQLVIDCASSRYKGLSWQWVDQDGTQSESAEADAHWTAIMTETPIDYAARFICSQ